MNTHSKRQIVKRNDQVSKNKKVRSKQATSNKQYIQSNMGLADSLRQSELMSNWQREENIHQGRHAVQLQGNHQRQQNNSNIWSSERTIVGLDVKNSSHLQTSDFCGHSPSIQIQMNNVNYESDGSQKVNQTDHVAANNCLKNANTSKINHRADQATSQSQQNPMVKNNQNGSVINLIVNESINYSSNGRHTNKNQKGENFGGRDGNRMNLISRSSEIGDNRVEQNPNIKRNYHGYKTQYFAQSKMNSIDYQRGFSVQVGKDLFTSYKTPYFDSTNYKPSKPQVESSQQLSKTQSMVSPVNPAAGGEKINLIKEDPYLKYSVFNHIYHGKQSTSNTRYDLLQAKRESRALRRAKKMQIQNGNFEDAYILKALQNTERILIKRMIDDQILQIASDGQLPEKITHSELSAIMSHETRVFNSQNTAVASPRLETPLKLHKGQGDKIFDKQMGASYKMFEQKNFIETAGDDDEQISLTKDERNMLSPDNCLIMNSPKNQYSSDTQQIVTSRGNDDKYVSEKETNFLQRNIYTHQNEENNMFDINIAMLTNREVEQKHGAPKKQKTRRNKKHKNELEMNANGGRTYYDQRTYQLHDLKVAAIEACQAAQLNSIQNQQISSLNNKTNSLKHYLPQNIKGSLIKMNLDLVNIDRHNLPNFQSKQMYKNLSAKTRFQTHSKSVSKNVEILKNFQKQKQTGATRNTYLNISEPVLGHRSTLIHRMSNHLQECEVVYHMTQNTICDIDQVMHSKNVFNQSNYQSNDELCQAAITNSSHGSKQSSRERKVGFQESVGNEEANILIQNGAIKHPTPNMDEKLFKSELITHKNIRGPILKLSKCPRNQNKFKRQIQASSSQLNSNSTLPNSKSHKYHEKQRSQNYGSAQKQLNDGVRFDVGMGPELLSSLENNQDYFNKQSILAMSQGEIYSIESNLHCVGCTSLSQTRGQSREDQSGIPIKYSIPSRLKRFTVIHGPKSAYNSSQPKNQFQLLGQENQQVQSNLKRRQKKSQNTVNSYLSKSQGSQSRQNSNNVTLLNQKLSIAEKQQDINDTSQMIEGDPKVVKSFDHRIKKDGTLKQNAAAERVSEEADDCDNSFVSRGSSKRVDQIREGKEISKSQKHNGKIMSVNCKKIQNLVEVNQDQPMTEDHLADPQIDSRVTTILPNQKKICNFSRQSGTDHHPTATNEENIRIQEYSTTGQIRESKRNLASGGVQGDISIIYNGISQPKLKNYLTLRSNRHHLDSKTFSHNKKHKKSKNNLSKDFKSTHQIHNMGDYMQFNESKGVQSSENSTVEYKYLIRNLQRQSLRENRRANNVSNRNYAKQKSESLMVAPNKNCPQDAKLISCRTNLDFNNCFTNREQYCDYNCSSGALEQVENFNEHLSQGHHDQVETQVEGDGDVMGKAVQKFRSNVMNSRQQPQTGFSAQTGGQSQVRHGVLSSNDNQIYNSTRAPVRKTVGKGRGYLLQGLGNQTNLTCGFSKNNLSNGKMYNFNNQQMNFDKHKLQKIAKPYIMSAHTTNMGTSSMKMSQMNFNNKNMAMGSPQLISAMMNQGVGNSVNISSNIHRDKMGTNYQSQQFHQSPVQKPHHSHTNIYNKSYVAPTAGGFRVYGSQKQEQKINSQNFSCDRGYTTNLSQTSQHIGLSLKSQRDMFGNMTSQKDLILESEKSQRNIHSSNILFRKNKNNYLIKSSGVDEIRKARNLEHAENTAYVGSDFNGFNLQEVKSTNFHQVRNHSLKMINRSNPKGDYASHQSLAESNDYNIIERGNKLSKSKNI